MKSMRAVFRAVVWLALSIVSGCGAIDFNDVNVPSPKRQYLCFTDLSQIHDFDSATIFFTQGEVDYVIADAFFVFADRIGRTNGATTVDTGNYAAYSDAMIALGCPPLTSNQLPAIVFTAKNLDNCQVFPVERPEALSEILITIERNLECPTDVTIERLARQIKRAVLVVAQKWDVVAALVPPTTDLIDFLAEQLRVTCK